MKRELAAYFLDVSRVRPLVLLLEDLHWADASTVDVLNYLAGRFEGMRLLVLVTYRPSDMALSRHPFLQVARQLHAASAFVECPLEHLDRADVERYLGLEFPGHALPPSFVTLIHEKTEGHPLFMVDLVRYLRDRGDLVRNGGRWNLTHSTADVARELPETVKGTIARKIDRLDDLDRRLLTAASVQGHEFDTVVVSDVLALDPADVEDRLAGLDADPPARAANPLRRAARSVPLGAVPLRACALPERALRIPAADPPRILRGQGGPVTGGAPWRRQRARCAAELALLYETARDFGASAHYFTAAAQHAMRLFGFREALSLVGARARRGRRDARRPRAHAAGTRAADGEGCRPALHDGLGDARHRADFCAGARSSVTSSATLRRSFQCSGRSPCSTLFAATCSSAAPVATS